MLEQELPQQALKKIFFQAFMPDMENSLQRLLHSADDNMLKMACEATENKEQNRYFEALQSYRISHLELAQLFLTLLAEPQQIEGLAIDELHLQSLLKLTRTSGQGWQQDKRLCELSERVSARLKAIDESWPNPLQPDVFSHAFAVSLAQVDMDMHSKMLLLRLFESQLYQRLGNFLSAADQALLAANILPELISVSPDDLSVEHIVSATLGEHESSESQQHSVLAEALIDHQADQFEALDEKLSLAQLLVADAAVEDYTELLSASLASFSSEDIETARLVKALFSELLLDESLPQLGRVLLVMLQLPYTRIALAEPDFLETDSHPARMLLGQLSELALIWDVAADEKQIADDPVLEQFRRIIQRFYEAEHLYLIPFTDLLFAAVLCTEEQRQKNARSTEQAITSAMSASSSDQLRQSISQLLAQKTEGMSLPKAVQRLLDDAWAHVMYVNALAYGVESEMWRQDEAVVNALLASIAAPETFNNREQLISMLPSLLTALRSGMYSIELNSTLIHQLLSDLEELHKTMIIQISDSGQLIDFSASALSQQQAPSALPLIDARLEALAAEQTAAAEVAHDEGEIANQQAPESLDAEDILSRIGQGVWLDWHRSDHKERCQVAAHIKHAKKYILTNSGGRKIADVEEDLMAQLLASGEMMLAEPGQVFEKALESVIGGIRSTR